ncbi:MAG: radical SAM protein, partial [Thermoguttaceae bacterium]
MTEGLLYYPLSYFFRRQFGQRVWKISVDAGLSCPNVDGTLGRGGCIFCDLRSFSPSRRLKAAGRPITDQIADGARRLQLRYRVSASSFIAYFQPATNTHAPLERLLPLWREALAQPRVVGLTVGTRPDCITDEVLDALKELAEDRWVSVEYGLQSVHQHSLDWLGRQHDFACFEDATLR